MTGITISSADVTRKLLFRKIILTTVCKKWNEYMIDNSNFVIAVWDGRPSGTGNTVRYAESKGKKIIRINP